ncbi:acyltransferase [Fibrobacter sp. UWH4]|uniref:acyltransferase family protein n=1 Tax=Fibrobacter sp. UWH4 TaxID=1896210 RepID=UPI0009170973|nr:acyltransferase [Fibrobacter sp. UWH4]SHL82352.1 Acyltransferase family protein [Fibrobacter sp. UWH4]
MSDKATRIGWIDEFKGFVLLLVCFYHIEQSFSNVSMGMLHLSALRMSAFFFISGMLFSTRRFSDFKSYFIHKTRVLLIPYILLSLLFLALDPVLYHFEWFPRAPRMTIMNIKPEITGVWDYLYWNLAKIFIAGKSSIGSGPLWFVFTLYSVSLMFYGVMVISKRIESWIPSLRSRMTVAGIAIASLIAGWLLYKNHIRLPFGIERDLTVLFFFTCGWICREPIKNLSRDCFGFRSSNDIQYTALQRCSGTLLTAGIALISFVLYAFVENPDPNFSIMNNVLGKSLGFFLASSFFGIAGLIATFIVADKLPNIAPIRIAKGILRNISRNALVILAVHWWILLVLRIVFKSELDKPGTAYLSAIIVTVAVTIAIPIFRCKLYKLLGKEKVSVRESLRIRD